MTNYHAIATVTAVLRDVLYNDLKGPFNQIAVTSKPPDVVEKETGKLRLNLFLYHVIPNAGFRTLSDAHSKPRGDLCQKTHGRSKSVLLDDRIS